MIIMFFQFLILIVNEIVRTLNLCFKNVEKISTGTQTTNNEVMLHCLKCKKSQPCEILCPKEYDIPNFMTSFECDICKELYYIMDHQGYSIELRDMETMKKDQTHIRKSFNSIIRYQQKLLMESEEIQEHIKNQIRGGKSFIVDRNGFRELKNYATNM